MNDQKNLFLAIILSILIIIVFQFFFPQTSVVSTSVENNETDIQPATSIDQKQKIDRTTIKTKEDVISESDRITIETKSLSGSVNLTGAILDDLVLLNYKESLKEN